tara:strand:- start:99 stop:935 length:837 start_codon:yes stop_codon:yes gene_type:complete
MTKKDNKVINALTKQHSDLKKYIKSTPDLGKLLYQGKSLKFHSSDLGLKKLLMAYNKRKYDEISLNHGLKRLQLFKKSKVIWHYPSIKYKIRFKDKTIKMLETKSQKIKIEALNAIRSLKKFPDNDTLVNKKGLWSYFPFYNKNGSKIKSAHKLCPTISKILSKLDLNTLMGFSFLSALAKKSKISAHCGSTSLRKRYHYPIIIPEKKRCKIRVGKKWIFWRENKAFSFYDAVEHEVINNSKDLRLLLIFDVWSDHLPKSIKRFLKKNNKILNYGIVS